MVKLKQEYKDNSIPVSELKDGQIGVITQWSPIVECIGTIVQNNDGSLFVIGGTYQKGWNSITEKTDCRVRVLENGTELIITNNQ